MQGMIAEPILPIESSTDRVVIIASADERVRARIVLDLRAQAARCYEALGGAHALELHEKFVNQRERVMIILDRYLPDLQSGEVAQIAKSIDPNTLVHLLETPDAEVPLSPGSVEPLCPRAVEPASVNSSPECPLPGMIGESEAIQRVYRLVSLVAPRDTTVLITGETGTGKELVAKALHLKSKRAKAPFVTVNCSAIPDTLLESELFGYVKGAFTGAAQQSVGRIKAAEGGTIFLDEIGELSPTMQAKLLRFLQEGEVQRLGELKASRVDVRVVAATNIDLTDRSNSRIGGFRQDLYYRLAVFPVELPRLRERGRDSLLIARYFLKKYGGSDRVLSRDAEQLICQYVWPGNVRELQHAIERAVILAQDDKIITAGHLGLSTNQLSFF